MLELVNPRLDRIQGIWFFEKTGPLRSPCEFEARLQVAVEPPRGYSLDMTIERLQGSECFRLGIVVDGHQTMLEIDGYNSTVSGIHDLDGKPAKDNESRREGIFLPLRKRTLVQLKGGEVTISSRDSTQFCSRFFRSGGSK